MLPNPYEEYKRGSIAGKNELQVLVMLFDGMMKFLRQAKEAIRAKDIETSHEMLVKARRIVMHLLPTVNLESGGEAAAKLHSLYVFCFTKIAEANLKKSIADIDGVLGVVRILKETWAELEVQEARGGAFSATPQGLERPAVSMAV